MFFRADEPIGNPRLEALATARHQLIEDDGVQVADLVPRAGPQAREADLFVDDVLSLERPEVEGQRYGQGCGRNCLDRRDRIDHRASVDAKQPHRHARVHRLDQRLGGECRQLRLIEQHGE